MGKGSGLIEGKPNTGEAWCEARIPLSIHQGKSRVAKAHLPRGQRGGFNGIREGGDEGRDFDKLRKAARSCG